MVNTVYTGVRHWGRAVIEETKLNGLTDHHSQLWDSNRLLYDLVQEANAILRQPLTEPLDVKLLESLEQDFARYSGFKLSLQYQKKLATCRDFHHSMTQAQRIIEGQSVFSLDQVAESIRDLGKYSSVSVDARAYRQELDNLWILIQKGKLYAEGIPPIATSETREQLAARLEPYAKCSSEISGVHRLLADHLELQNLFAGFPEIQAEDEQLAT